MGSLSSDDDEETLFFDARENIAMATSSESDCLDCLNSGYGVDVRESSSFEYNLWVRSPRSVKQRRNDFLRWMDLNVDMRLDELIDTYGDVVPEGEIDRIMGSSGAVLGTSAFGDECSPNKYSSNEENLGNSDGRTLSNEDILGKDGRLSKLQLSDEGRLTSSERLDSTSAPPSLVYQLFQRESQVADDVLRDRTRTRMKRWWMRRLHSMTSITESIERGNDLWVNSFNPLYAGVSKGEMDRVRESNGAVLGFSTFKGEYSLNNYLASSCSVYCVDSPRGSGSKDGLVCKIGNSDGRAAANEDNVGHDGRLSRLQSSNVDRLMSSKGFDGTSSTSHLVDPLLQGESQVADDVFRVKMRSRMKNWWLRRLHSISAAMERIERGNGQWLNSSNPFLDAKIQRVRVRHYRKRSKELSALFTGKDIQAHDGSILTMKFSLDGQYLASAGEDKVIRVWQVIEDERSNEIDIPDIDPSCIYFTVNHLSELSPLVTEKNKMNKLKSLRKTSDSACLIFPPKVFRILEKCLHEFCGHDGEVLDLSWSTNNHLLSSSVDRTVRLWRIGCEECLKVFSHSNYVTCIQFNPVNENYFISGSIDGKVRIWAIERRQVVDWIDNKDIVTAVTYQPDAKAVIVGSLSGNCCFFSLSDNHLHLEEQMCLNSKKKSPYKGITGFQFFPQDSSKVMVTSGDSQAIILNGSNIIKKYSGLRNAGNLISAFFTSDGNYIVSASEDSNIYVWRCSSQEDFSLSSPKKIKSFDCFPMDASVAIPWSGLKLGNYLNQWQFHVSHGGSFNTLQFSPSACFSLNQEYFLEAIPKGSATWPEEKLPSSSPQGVPSILCRSHYNFFGNSCQNSSSSHAWGLVIVTGGWDGRIRSFHNYGLPIPL